MIFLPQFIDPGYPALPQAMLMASIHFTIGMLLQGVMDSVIGVLLVGFGVKMAESQ